MASVIEEEVVAQSLRADKFYGIYTNRGEAVCIAKHGLVKAKGKPVPRRAAKKKGIKNGG